LKLYKRFSQHLLASKNVLNKIITAGELTNSDVVLEIGAGDGRLTELIAQVANYVFAVEIDKRMINLLKERFKDRKNVKIINANILKLELKELRPSPNKVIGNIPYHITGPILEKLLENKIFELIIIMLQEEVAKRIIAKVGSSYYSRLTIYVNYHTLPELICKVSKNLFIPVPRVNSALVKLKILDNPPVELIDEKLFFYIVKVAFCNRRKKIINALNSVLNKHELSNLLDELGISKDLRPQNISMSEYSRLINVLPSS